MAPVHPVELQHRMLDWLRAQGIELNQTIVRHVVGIVKSLETGPHKTQQ